MVPAASANRLDPTGAICAIAAVSGGHLLCKVLCSLGDDLSVMLCSRNVRLCRDQPHRATSILDSGPEERGGDIDLT